MDGSFLSDQAVVRASRKFICIRLATYEDAEEAKILRSLFAGRNDNLENSVFAILGPDGKLQLTRTGRSPGWAFGDSEQAPTIMAQTMERLAKRYARKSAKYNADLALPAHAGFRLALNVAACDNRPLVVGYHPEKAGLAQLERQLRKVAWHESLIGRCEYVMVNDAAELKPVRALSQTPTPGVYVIRPGLFGEFGRVLSTIPTGTESKTLRDKVLTASAVLKVVHKQQRDHTRLGNEMGVHWKTAIPVTDSHSVGERSRTGSRSSRRRR